MGWGWRRAGGGSQSSSGLATRFFVFLWVWFWVWLRFRVCAYACVCAGVFGYQRVRISECGCVSVGVTVFVGRNPYSRKNWHSGNRNGRQKCVKNTPMGGDSPSIPIFQTCLGCCSIRKRSLTCLKNVHIVSDDHRRWFRVN